MSRSSSREQSFNSFLSYSVLITGPSGSGKTTLAKKIHERSKRKGEFVTVNLASLHSGTIEAEVFGYERGAFTGADRSRPGLLEEADQGTVFFDEVGELPLELQPRLLEFVDTGRIRRMGASRGRKLDVKIISATNRNLYSEVKERRFREDLFFRLRAQEVRLKSIKDNGVRFDGLVHEVLEEVSQSSGKNCIQIAPEVASRLERYRWPGNYRELKNVLTFASSQMDGDHLTEKCLPDWFIEETAVKVSSEESLGVIEMEVPINYSQARKKFENEFFRKALDHFNGDLEACLKATQVSRATFYRKK